MKHEGQSPETLSTSQAKKLAKRGPQTAETGSKPEADGQDEEVEEPQADTTPAIALD